MEGGGGEGWWEMEGIENGHCGMSGSGHCSHVG